MTKPVGAKALSGALPLASRKAQIQPQTDAQASAREFDVVMSAGATVRRYRWENWDTVPYDETLTISDEAVNTTRVDEGAVPLLDSHSAYGGITTTLGKVMRAWVQDGVLWGRIRLHEAGVSEAADALAGQIRGGTAPSLSVGYTSDEIVVTQAKDAPEQAQVVRWTLYELSAVPIPADMQAGFRSAETRTFPCVVNRAQEPNSKETEMVVKTNDAPGAEPGVETRAADPAAVTAATAAAVEQATKAERTRVAEINTLSARHKLPADMTAKAIADGVSLEAFRASALDHLATADEKRVTVTGTGAASGDDPAVRRSAMEGALVHRILSGFGRKVEPSAHERSYMEFSLAEMAAEVLGQRSTRLSAAQRDAIFTRAYHSTSDFPGLMENVANKVLLDRYALAAPTFKTIASERNLVDFKPTRLVRPGDFPNLLKVGESGEIKAGTFSESKETFQLATYGRQVRFTRELLINDDLNGIGQMLAGVGDRVAAFENATFWAFVLSNPVLATDSVAVFDTATHKNLASSGTGITVAALSAGRQAMMNQNSLDGIPLNLLPKYLVVGAAKITEAEQITTPVLANVNSNVNTIGPKLTPVGDANIPGNLWMLFTERGAADTFVYGHLDGAPGPQVRTDVPFGINGMAMQVVLDFGVGAQDFRGAYQNPGN